MTDKRKTLYTFTRSSMDLKSFLDLVHSRHSQSQKILNKQSLSKEDDSSGKKRKREDVEIRKRELETRLEECRKKKEKLNEEVAALKQQKQKQIETKHELLLKLKQELAAKNRTSRTCPNGDTPTRKWDRDDAGLKGRFQNPLSKSSGLDSMSSPHRQHLPPHLSCPDQSLSINRLPPHMKKTGKAFDRGHVITENKADERNHKVAKTASIVCRTKDS
eukprot:g3350.t1